MSETAQRLPPRQPALSPSEPKRNQTPESSMARPTVRKRRTDPTSSTIAHSARHFQMVRCEERKYFIVGRRWRKRSCIGNSVFTSNVDELGGPRRALLDESKTGFRFRSHQTLDGFGGRRAVRRDHGDPKQRPLCRVHRRLAKIARRHFAEPLKTADFNLTATDKSRPQHLLLMRIVARVHRFCALRQPVQGWNRQIEMAFLDEFGRLSVEEGDQQRGDVRAVHVRIRHYDDLVITQVLGAILTSGASAEGLQEIAKLLILRQLVARGGSNVENL